MPNGYINGIKQPRKGSKTEAILTLSTLPNLSNSEIAIITQCSNQNIHATLQRYHIDLKPLDLFKKHRADVLAGMQERLLSSIDDEQIKGAPLGTKVLAACQLYDKERLERDLSTSNLASIHGDIAALRKKEREGNG